ncbi:MAG: hypothetical protein R3359_04945 [Marinirhabdus sp.]|nr:hypothetical protein [Marinirhabdus sp.]
MRSLIMVLTVFALFSCQKESLVVREDTSDERYVIDNELSELMVSVSAHDGSFDDVLDAAGCFSIQFPYTILYNGEFKEINSVNDLLGLDTGQDVVFEFPITITYSNYVSQTLRSADELLLASASCSSNTFFLNAIRCVDFIYPIRITQFNSETNDFNTLVIDHDQENFTTIVELLDTQLAEIRFPVSLQLSNDMVVEVVNAQELKQFIYLHSEDCE